MSEDLLVFVFPTLVVDLLTAFLALVAVFDLLLTLALVVVDLALLDEADLVSDLEALVFVFAFETGFFA
ncbi:MAG: hypothetical protein RIF34_01955, partial [Candidatus Kapaibacterium sp.]